MFNDLDATFNGQEIDEDSFKFDATHINAYGEIFVLIPSPNPPAQHELLGSGAFGGSVQFVTGNNRWSSNIDSIDGAQFLQLRISFLSNIETGLSPELSAIGIAYSE